MSLRSQGLLLRRHVVQRPVILVQLPRCQGSEHMVKQSELPRDLLAEIERMGYRQEGSEPSVGLVLLVVLIRVLPRFPPVQTFKGDVASGQPIDTSRLSLSSVLLLYRFTLAAPSLRIVCRLSN